MADVKQPPRRVRTASALMVSVLPAGLIVTVMNLVAVDQTYAALPSAPVRINAFIVDTALRRYPEFGRERTLAIAIFYGAAGFVFGVFAWLVRRGAWRRPVVILVPASVYGAVYAVALVVVYVQNPVSGYQNEHIRNAPIPWAMADVRPGWYLPSLRVTLLLAALAQFAALVLLVRAGRPWRAASAVAPARARATARAAFILLIAPAFAAIYAALNHLAIASARAALGSEGNVDPYVPEVAGRNWDHAKLLAVVLGIATAIMIAALLWAWSGRPGGVTLAGVLSVPYSLVLWVTWWLRPLDEEFFFDDQSGLNAARPAWHPTALALLVAAGVLTIGTSLVLLTRRSWGPGPRSDPVRPDEDLRR